MSRLFLRLMLVVGIGMTAAACQDDGYGAPRGYYQPQPARATAAGPYYSTAAYYAPAPSRYGYSQPAPNYNSTTAVAIPR